MFMNDHEQNSMGIRTFTEALQVCDPNPITHEPSNNLPLKAIGTLQEENLVLARRVRELEQSPCQLKDEEASETNNAKSHLDEIRSFGRIYTYMVNMSITVKECKPSKKARN